MVLYMAKHDVAQCPRRNERPVCAIGLKIESCCWQVLENLLSNAVKYSPTGGEVALSADLRGDWVLVHVRDSGPGFTTADRERMFTRYGRLSARPTGGESSTGLGLHIAHVLARRMGGSVALGPDSGPDGSNFTLTLPAASPAS